jgi:tRNA U34 5-carboxymethylaminomethyl modifying GTPase MnmE/TrmE
LPPLKKGDIGIDEICIFGQNMSVAKNTKEGHLVKTLEQQIERLLELREDTSVTVGMISEAKSKIALYMQNPDMIGNFNEEKMRNDLDRYSKHLRDIQEELNKIDGQIQKLVGVNST